MTNNWHVSRVDIARFRGVADRVAFDLQPGLNVITGPNGAGKTSTCHALEWALFGKVPGFSGPEFQDEDSISNRLVEGPSEVRLTLERPGATLQVTRTRGQGASSTRGTSRLSADLGSSQVSGAAADALLTVELGVSQADLGAGFYLRQDTVADIVLGDAQVRSAAIDKLLGLGQVRLLLQNLQLPIIERATKSVDTEALTLQETVITAASLRRQQLFQERDRLIMQGIAEGDLTIAGAATLCSQLSNRLQRLAGIAGMIIPVVGIGHQTPAELQAVASSMREEAAALSRRLEELADSLTSKRAAISSLQSRFKLAEATYDQLSSSELSSKEAEAAALTKQTGECTEEVIKLGSLLASVTPLASQLKSLHIELAGLSSASNNEQVAALERQRLGLREEWKRIDAQLRAYSSLDQLLASAQTHLRSHPQDRCPICTQSIDVDLVLSQLEGQLEASKSQAGQLQARNNEIKVEGQTLGEQIDFHRANLQRLATGGEQSVSLVDRLKAYGLIVTSSEPDAIADAIAAVATKHKSISERRTVLSEQLAEADARISKHRSAASELKAVKDEAMGILGAADESGQLSEDLNERIASLADRSRVIEEARSQVRELQSDQSKTEAVIRYLKDFDDAKRLEDDVPAVKAKLRQLEVARHRLESLYQTVAEIHTALSVVQQEALSGNLSSLMPSAQAFFEALGAHPEYSNLVIEPVQDVKTGANIYRLRAETNDRARNTFVRTTFSRGELNSVALALFMSVAASDRSTFGLSILDDPSQSLDTARQKALVSVLMSVAQSRQIVIATEDRDFAGMCRQGGACVISLRHAPFKGTSVAPETQLA